MSILRSSPPTRRRRTNRERPLRVAAGGFVVLAVLAGLVYLVARVPNGAPLLSYTTLYADVQDPGNLQPHSEVRIHGKRVGQVIDITSQRGRARVEFKLDPGAEPPPKDTAAFIRAKGLLGARFLDLRPGTSRALLEEGDSVRGDANALSLGVPEALTTFDAETRGALGEMAAEFGRGLLARGNELNQALRVSPAGARSARSLIDEILDRPGAARRFVPSLEQGAAAFDEAREEFIRMLPPMAKGMQPFYDRRQATRAMLAEAPSALGAMQSGLSEGRRLLTAARALSRAAAATLPRAPRGLRATTKLLRESDVPLQRTSTLLDALRPAVPNVLRITRSLSPNLDPLRRAFADLQRFSGDVAPASCDIENLADNLRSMIAWTQGPGGPIGPILGFRAEAILGPEAIGPAARAPDAVEAGSISEFYPAPCKHSPGKRYDLSPLPAPGGRR